MALLVSTCTLRGDNVRGPRWSTGISRLAGGVFTHHPGLQLSLADALVACQSKAHRVGKEPLGWIAFYLRLPSVARHPGYVLESFCLVSRRGIMPTRAEILDTLT